MAGHHYHANHVDAPARSSKAQAMRDARSLRVINHVYAQDAETFRVDPLVSGESIREHGTEFPLLVRCSDVCVVIAP